MKTILSLIETGGPGGAETVCVQLLTGLDSSRWRGIAATQYRGWLQDRLLESTIETHIIPEPGVLGIAPFMTRMAALVRRRNVDLIHAHLFGSALRAGVLSRLTGVPAIATLHGVADLAPTERFLGVKSAILRRGLSRVVFVSDPLRAEFLDLVRFPAERVVVIPNGIDASRFEAPRDAALRASLGFPADAYVVGAVGNMNAAKGFDVFLHAAAILKARSPAYRFVIVGDSNGRQSAELTALRAKLDLTNDVLFTGFRSDIPQLLGTFDAYALTSRSEGFSISIVEAMASSLPVVATRCGGPEQIVADGRTGLLVENGSAEAVAAAIERVRTDGAFATALGRAARTAVQERFTVSAQTRAYQALYEECGRERAPDGAPSLQRVNDPPR